MSKPITAINFNSKRDEELFTKLNAVVPVLNKLNKYQVKAHAFAKTTLMKELDELIEQHGIDIYASTAQPAIG